VFKVQLVCKVRRDFRAIKVSRVTPDSRAHKAIKEQQAQLDRKVIRVSKEPQVLKA